jgi:hypothetical protein
LLDWQWPTRGPLAGRVLGESLAGPASAYGRSRVAAQRCTRRSAPMPNGMRTVLDYQRAAGRLYVDEARFELAGRGGGGAAAASPETCNALR